MSSTPRQFFTSADLAMIGRVLDQAKFQQSVFPKECEARLDAARFLIARFQEGVTDERGLHSRLADRAPDSSGPVAPPVSDAANQTLDNRASQSGPADQSHQFGKRIETNGSWTIYHVFTGVPANFGDWKMVQLDVKTAVRALKILNSSKPETVSPEAARPADEPVEDPVRRKHVSMADRARAFDKYD